MNFIINFVVFMITTAMAFINNFKVSLVIGAVVYALLANFNPVLAGPQDPARVEPWSELRGSYMEVLEAKRLAEEKDYRNEQGFRTGKEPNAEVCKLYLDPDMLAYYKRANGETKGQLIWYTLLTRRGCNAFITTK